MTLVGLIGFIPAVVASLSFYVIDRSALLEAGHRLPWVIPTLVGTASIFLGVLALASVFALTPGGFAFIFLVSTMIGLALNIIVQKYWSRVGTTVSGEGD